jgi:hypothetical protein
MASNSTPQIKVTDADESTGLLSGARDSNAAQQDGAAQTAAVVPKRAEDGDGDEPDDAGILSAARRFYSRNLGLLLVFLAQICASLVGLRQ